MYTTNKVADALSRAPLQGASNVRGKVLQVSQLELEPSQVMLRQIQQQQQDPELVKPMDYLKSRSLPDDPREAKVIVNLSRKRCFVVDNVLKWCAKQT